MCVLLGKVCKVIRHVDVKKSRVVSVSDILHQGFAYTQKDQISNL